MTGLNKRRRPSGEGEKWKVNRAVRASTTLPAPARLIMLVLSDIADAGTAELPPSKNPSTAQLARETGISVSTVKKYRTALEAAGWIEYKRPTLEQQKRHESGTYKLRVPPGEGQQRRGVGTRPTPGATHDPLSNNDQNNDRENDPALRDAVERVCRQLADRIEANGSPRPPITPAWAATVAALILDDGYDEDRIGRAIDFAHSDTFWRMHITTPMALRGKWHDLRLSAEHAIARERERAARGATVALPPPVPPGAPPRAAPVDIVAGARAELAEIRTTVHAVQSRQQHRTTQPRQEP